MTAIYLEKRNRIIDFLSNTNESKILDKVDKLISKIEMPKPMTEEELIMKIEESEEAYKKGKYITLDELKRKFGSTK